MEEKKAILPLRNIFTSVENNSVYKCNLKRVGIIIDRLI